MSQTNPRKPALRTPNGTDTSPAAASSDAPAQSVPQPIHHPLPKHPHTYIPAHLKSNGPRTQHPRGRSSKSNTSVDESPEIKALRAKYGDKLSNLKETFGTWSDEDLLSLLSESNGNVDSVATMILEGRVEHWDSVSHKKKDKATPAGVTGGPHTAARDRAEAGGSASPGRGGFRGGRGGTPGRGGARGGRGGGAGGRGGFANGSGRVAGADGTTASPAAENPTTTADAWGSADASASWGTDGAWGESASGASKEKEAPVPTKTPPVKGQQQPSKAPAKAQAPAGPPKMSWAQIAKKGKPAESPVAPPVKAPAPVPPPSLPATSSAQPVSEPTPSEPPAAPEPEPAPVDSTTDPVEESAALEPQSTDEDGPEEATTAPSDDWIAVTPPNQQIPVELPTTTVPVVEEPKAVEAEVKSITTEAPKAPEPAPTAQQSSSVSTLQPTGAPPGLSPVPQPASTPSTATVTSPAATVASTAAPSVPAKSSTPRLGSSRPASRFRTTDAPVVMPGGGLPTTVFGSLSFGNAITPDVPSFGGPGLESRFGMQFGSLSLNDDIDGSGPIEPPVAEAPAPVSQQEPPAPVTIAEPEPAPAPAPVPAPVPVPTQAAAPAPAPQPPQPVPQPVVAAPQPTAPAQPVQQSPRVLSSSTAINSLFQHAQQPAQQSLPQQVATTPSLNATQPPPPQQPTPSAPSKVDALPPFLQQGAPGLLSHLQQPSHHVPPSQQQPPASHLPPHLSQPQQLGSPAQQSQQLAGSQGQQSLPYSVGGGQHLPPHLDTSSLPQTQQPASATSISAPHPALAAQNSYFRNAGAESFYHAPTPPQTQLPQQLQQQDHSSPYGAFSPLGQPQQTQGGQFGGFNNSPAGADYGYDAQRGFYDSYAQGSGFQNRPQLAHDEPAKGGLQPSTPTNVLPGQQNLNLGQGQPGGAQSGVANPGPGFGMVPYPYYQQPAYFPPPVPAQYNPYSQYKYNPYSQPPPGPSGPGPQGLQGNKPPTTGTASPYGSQHYPSQSTPYDDPASVGYQQGTTSATDYQKQQPLYGGQGLQNFFGNQSTGQNGPQLGGAQGGRTSATSSSPENPYKAYGSGPGVGADKSAAGQQGGAGRAAGGPGPQSQQGGYYPNSQYSTQRQPPAQGYPQGDGQQYYSGYQPRNQYGGAW